MKILKLNPHHSNLCVHKKKKKLRMWNQIDLGSNRGCASCEKYDPCILSFPFVKWG